MRGILALIVMFLCSPVWAQTTTIDNLTADSSVASTDVTVTVDKSGTATTKKATWGTVFSGLLPTSAALAGFLSNETGTGAVVFSNSPVLVTPNIGTATGSLTGNAATATALYSNGANCADGQAPLGVDASGASENCFDVATQNELDAISVGNVSGWVDGGTTVYPATTSDFVGVGTTNSTSSLEVVRTAGYAPLMISSSATGDGNYLIVNSVGNIGIGSTNPSRLVDIVTPNTSGLRILYSAASGALNSSVVSIGVNDGAATSSGDRLGGVYFGGMTTASAYTEGGSVVGMAEGDWSGTSAATGLSLSTVASGATSRTERMRISNTGNIGIGTAIPTAVVSIIKASTYPYLMLSSAAAQTGDIMVVTSAGNVGIGTISASNLVHVNGDARIGSGTFSQTSGNSDLYVQGNVQVGGYYYGDGSQLTGITGATGGGWTDGGSVMYQTTTTDYVGVGTTNPTTTLEIVKQTSTSPLMISATATGDGDILLVNSAGNIGVGTLLPSNKFEVSGTVAASSLVGLGTTQGELRLVEAKANGGSYLALKAPASLSGNVTWTLPDADSSGCFSSDGSGTVTITTCGGGAAAAGWTDGGTNIYTTTTTDTVGIGTTTASGTLEVVQQGSTAPLMISSTATSDGNRLIVTSGGNVGIGTTTPTNTLTVNGSIKAIGSGVSIFNQGNVGIGTITVPAALVVGAGGSIGSAGAGDVYMSGDLEVDGTVYMASCSGAGCGSTGGWTDGGTTITTTTTTDAVGIGTTTVADGILQIGGDNVTVGIGGTNDQATAAGELYVKSDLEVDGTVYMASCSGAGCGAGTGGWTDGGTSVYLTTSTDYVGIGTTKPATALEVKGAIPQIKLYGTDSSQYPEYALYNDSGSEGGGFSIGGTATGADANSLFFFVNGANPIQFQSNSATRIYVAGAGNVGIGTTNPQAKLQVDSVIRTLKTDSPGTCDATLEGGFYYDDSVNAFCFCNGSAWAQVDGGGACS